MFNCDVVLKGNATSAELKLLGSALWRLARPVDGATGMYQLLDNQALADLIDGQFPSSSQCGAGDVHVVIPDNISLDREATIDGLLKGVPAQGVEHLLVDGVFAQGWPRPQACCGQPDRQCATEAATS